MQPESKNQPFLRTPLSLIRIPEYVRHFEGSSEGVVFKVLQSSIWRVPLNQNGGKRGWQHALAQRYSKGILATYTSYEDLADRSGFGARQVRRLLERLVQIGLIQLEGYSREGFIVRLGVDNELFLDKFARESRAYIVSRLLKAEMIVGRDRASALERLAEDFGDEAVEELVVFSENLEEFPTWIVTPSEARKRGPKKSSRGRNWGQQVQNFMGQELGPLNPVEFTSPTAFLDSESFKKVGAPCQSSVTPQTKTNADSNVQDGSNSLFPIDKGIDKAKDIDENLPKFGSPKSAEKSKSSAPTLFENFTEPSQQEILESALIRIKSEPSWVGAEKAAREAMRLGATVPQANSYLAERLPEEYREQYAGVPRFAHRLYKIETFKDPSSDASTEASLMWRALAEDITGVNHAESSNFYQEVRGAYRKHLTSVFSWDQIIWTLKRVTRSRSDMKFLAQGGRNLITLVKQNGARYQEIYEEKVRREQDRERMRQADIAREKEREKLRQEAITREEMTPHQRRTFDRLYAQVAERQAFREEQKKIRAQQAAEADEERRKANPEMEKKYQELLERVTGRSKE